MQLFFFKFFSPITELELTIPDIDPNAGKAVTTTKKPFIGNKYLPPPNKYLPPTNQYLPPNNDITRDLTAPTL